jgi:hypothetical protein
VTDTVFNSTLFYLYRIQQPLYFDITVPSPCSITFGIIEICQRSVFVAICRLSGKHFAVTSSVSQSVSQSVCMTALCSTHLHDALRGLDLETSVRAGRQTHNDTEDTETSQIVLL